MPKYTFVVLANAVQSKDAEFNECYTSRMFLTFWTCPVLSQRSASN